MFYIADSIDYTRRFPEPEDPCYMTCVRIPFPLANTGRFPEPEDPCYRTTSFILQMELAEPCYSTNPVFSFVQLKGVSDVVRLLRRLKEIAIDNNNDEFVKPPTLIMMLEFLNEIEYATRIRLVGQFVTTDLPQPWKTLRKILMRCLSTRVTGVDQPTLQMTQMLYYIINNVHVDYAALLWEGLHYSHLNPTRAFPYPRFTKIIVDHILTENPNITKRLNEPYHRVANDEVVKSIFNYGKQKGLGMRIPDAPKKSTIIRIPRIRQPDPKTPILTAAQIDIAIEEHLMDEDIEKIVEGDEESNDNKFVNDIHNSQEDLDTRIEPESHKESPKAEKSVNLMSIDEEVKEESTEDLLTRKKGKGIV
ncbi:hypothetical protein Tco_0587658 [Tanacetum coccineum]